MINEIKKESYGYSAKTTISLFKSKEEIKIFFDEELGVISENSLILTKLTDFLDKKINFEDFLLTISKEVANICFSQSTKKPSKKEIKQFSEDISILKLNVFYNDVVFYFLSPTLLPGMVITCQIDFAKKIENIELVEQRFISFGEMLDKA